MVDWDELSGLSDPYFERDQYTETQTEWCQKESIPERNPRYLHASEPGIYTGRLIARRHLNRGQSAAIYLSVVAPATARRTPTAAGGTNPRKKCKIRRSNREQIAFLTKLIRVKSFPGTKEEGEAQEIFRDKA